MNRGSGSPNEQSVLTSGHAPTSPQLIHLQFSLLCNPFICVVDASLFDGSGWYFFDDLAISSGKIKSYISAKIIANSSLKVSRFCAEKLVNSYVEKDERAYCILYVESNNRPPAAKWSHTHPRETVKHRDSWPSTKAWRGGRVSRSEVTCRARIRPRLTSARTRPPISRAYCSRRRTINSYTATRWLYNVMCFKGV